MSSPSFFNSQGHRLSSAVRSDMLWPRRHENNPRFKKLVPIFENRFKSTAKNLWWTTQRATRLKTCKLHYFCNFYSRTIVGETQNQTVLVLRNASLHYRAVNKPVVFLAFQACFSHVSMNRISKIIHGRNEKIACTIFIFHLSWNETFHSTMQTWSDNNWQENSLKMAFVPQSISPWATTIIIFYI